MCLPFAKVLFNVFTNSVVSKLKCIQSRFAGDTKLGEAVDSLESREVLQSVLEKYSDMVIGHCGGGPSAGLDDLVILFSLNDSMIGGMGSQQPHEV